MHLTPPPAPCEVLVHCVLPCVRRRKALSLLQYLVSAEPTLSTRLLAPSADAAPTAAPPLLEHALRTLQVPAASSAQQQQQEEGGQALVEGTDVRQAAVELLGQLASTPAGWHALRQ